MREIIHRKDGITYERNSKKCDFDCNLNIHYWVDKREKLKVIANAYNIKYNKLCRDILDKYINENYEAALSIIEIDKNLTESK